MTITDPLRFEILDPIKLPLIKKLYKAHYPSGKAKADETTWVALDQQGIAALLRLKPVEHCSLLTGMLVIPTKRGQGVGHALLNHGEQHIFDPSIYCFAYAHLESYYAQHGFRTVTPEALPNSLKNLFQRYTGSGKDLIPMQFQP